MGSQAKKNNQSSNIILLGILIILAVAYFVINPSVGKIKDLNIKVNAKTIEVQKMQEKLDALELLKNKFNQSQEQVKKLGLAIPTENDMPEILVQLESMALKSGLKVNSIQPSKEGKKGVELINISMEGEYPPLVDFIDLTEKNIRLMTINSISLASAIQDEKTITNFTLELELLKGESNEQK